MAQILDGKKLAAELTTRIAQQVANLPVSPCLAILLVGNHPASEIYVGAKIKAAQAAGITTRLVRLSEAVTLPQVQEQIAALNHDPSITGILVQLPLPTHLDSAAVLSEISPVKDVDGLHPFNAGLLAQGQRGGFIPCTARACLHLIDAVHSEGVAGKHAVVIGRSHLVGRPTAQLLLARDCTVTIAHSKSRNLAGIARQAELLVVAAGQPEMIGADFIKPGATVIDVGIHRRSDGTLCGDVDFAGVASVAGATTPVPGGVGPLTVAYVLANLTGFN